jgi:high-affinity iron transporter
MLINSVILVLREALEAALMISVLLAVSRFLQIRLGWIYYAFGIGLAGATIYAQMLGPISELFEGVGQELFNAVLQYGTFFALAVVAFLISRQRNSTNKSNTTLPFMMAVAVALAVTREGSEVLIYVSGFVQMNDFLGSVGVGSIAGAAIGFSVGVLFYYLLLALDSRPALIISLLLLGLAASGMAAQATGLLIQADWLSVAGPLWNTSAYIAEDSLTGQLLYALVGYEASPSAIEVATYVTSISVMALSTLLGWTLFAMRSTESQ